MTDDRPGVAPDRGRRRRGWARRLASYGTLVVGPHGGFFRQSAVAGTWGPVRGKKLWSHN